MSIRYFSDNTQEKTMQIFTNCKFLLEFFIEEGFLSNDAALDAVQGDQGIQGYKNEKYTCY